MEELLMSEEELIETLRAFEKNRVEQLEEPAKNLFYAIMEIADERDRLNNIINEIEKDLEDRYYGRGKYNLSTDIVGIPTFLNRIKEIKGSEILL